MDSVGFLFKSSSSSSSSTSSSDLHRSASSSASAATFGRNHISPNFQQHQDPINQFHGFGCHSPDIASSLQTHQLHSWFHNRRLKDDNMATDLSPLIQRNTQLTSEQQSLLLLNSELHCQTLLLNLENKRLKEQLEAELQKQQQYHEEDSSSGSDQSLLLEYYSTNSEDDDEEDMEDDDEDVESSITDVSSWNSSP